MSDKYPTAGLKPCPFCGQDVHPDYDFPQYVIHQTNKNGFNHSRLFMNRNDWNIRPIEDELRARIAELEEKQRWRVVANGELPEDGEVVWLWDGKYIGMGYYLVFAGQFMDSDTPLRRIKPTHWMPLPESPNDTQTQTIVYRKESEE